MFGEHQRLKEAIIKLTGVHVDDQKVYLFETRLGDIMKQYNLQTYNDVAKKIEEREDQAFLEKIIEKITTHETRFFRDESIFDAILMQIIPEWLERNSLIRPNLGNATLDIWSAACSTGQEPYSVMMMLNEKMPDVAKITRMIGTDISRETLDRAVNGIYTQFEVERGLPPAFMNRYFSKLDNGYQISDQIRSRVQFKKQNLLTEPAPGKFDIIMCRNVVIYFEDHVRKDIYQTLKNALKPDGILIIGSSESLTGYVTNYVVREFGLVRYYEINPSQVTIFKR